MDFFVNELISFIKQKNNVLLVRPERSPYDRLGVGNPIRINRSVTKRIVAIRKYSDIQDMLNVEDLEQIAMPNRRKKNPAKYFREELSCPKNENIIVFQLE